MIKYFKQAFDFKYNKLKTLESASIGKTMHKTQYKSRKLYTILYVLITINSQLYVNKLTYVIMP